MRIGKEKFLTFGDNYLLIEFSFLEAPRNLYDIIFKLQLEGYKLVLYPYFTNSLIKAKLSSILLAPSSIPGIKWEWISTLILEKSIGSSFTCFFLNQLNIDVFYKQGKYMQLIEVSIRLLVDENVF